MAKKKINSGIRAVIAVLIIILIAVVGYFGYTYVNNDIKGNEEYKTDYTLILLTVCHSMIFLKGFTRTVSL